MKKIIIGFIGDHNVGKTTAANILRRKGFHKSSISDKVEEFAKHLFPDNNWNDNKNMILNRVRKRGCDQCKEYWLNLILIAVPDDKTFVVFDDLSIDEAESNKIGVYQIVRPGISTIELPDVKTIVNDGTLADFTKKIEDLYKELASKKSHSR